MGTAPLLRLILRRDRLRIFLWIAAIPLLVLLTAASVKSLFPTQSAIDQAAAATQHNAAAIAFNGPAQGLDTLGGQVAFQVGALGMVAVALMTIFMTGRLTRGDEEAGRLELVRSLPVGVHAPALAAVITVGSMNVVVGTLCAAALLIQGLPASGSLVLGASFAAEGLFFVGVALVAAQAAQNTRVVYGSCAGLVGLAYILRIVGDVGDGSVSWFSPIGVAQKARPYAGERWWPLAPLVVAAVVLTALALVLAARRDQGSGLVAPRPGRRSAAAGLGSPLGLALRLQRGTLIGWAGGVLVAGIAYGSIAPTVDAFVANNKSLAEILAGAGSGTLTDTYFATSLRLLALVASGFAVQSALRLRSEEAALLADMVLANPVSRWAWAVSHVAIAMAGSVALLAVAGLGAGLGYSAAGGPLSSVPRVLAASLAYAPAMWSITGVTVLIFGFAPRLAGLAWGMLAGCLVVGLLGDVLRAPGWILKLSPFESTPALPAAAMAITPLALLTVLSAALILVGLWGLRARDLG